MDTLRIHASEGRGSLVASARSTAVAAAGVPAPARILIVDQSEARARLVQTRLAGAAAPPFEFAWIDRLAPALTRLDDETFDLVLLDAELPDGRGLDALAQLRDRAPGMAIVLLTGSDDRALALQALRAGAQDCVQRGDVDGRRLGQRLRHAIARQRGDEARREREAQQHQADKLEAVGRLASGIAHNFNNLFAVILGYSEFMVRSLAANHPLCADAEEIKTATERAATLTQQMLAFSRGRITAPRPLDLNAVVCDALPALRRVAGDGVELVTRLDPAVLPLMADPGQIEQVLLHLATNAREAMPHGGRLGVETSRVAGGHPDRPGHELALLTVSDTGRGMDRDTCAHVFEPFFTTKPPGGGPGLGLAAVFGIVAQHGGQIEVQSAPGRGSTFRVYLPCVQAAPDGAPGRLPRERPPR